MLPSNNPTPSNQWTPSSVNPTTRTVGPSYVPSVESSINPSSAVIAHGDGCVENGIQYTCLPGAYCTNTSPYCYLCPINEYCPTGLYSYFCPTGLVSIKGSTSCSLPGIYISILNLYYASFWNKFLFH